MTLLIKYWKRHLLIQVLLAIALMGCGGQRTEQAPPDEIVTVEPAENYGKIYIDLTTTIDEVQIQKSTPSTLGKKIKEKIFRGKAKDITSLWAIQYTEAGIIEKIYPLMLTNSKYSFSPDLLNDRGYKFVFLAYEDKRWTGNQNEIYKGPTVPSTVIGFSGPINELNGVTDATGSASFLKTSINSPTDNETKTPIRAIANFDKWTNAQFEWREALSLFNSDEYFTGGNSLSSLGLRTGTAINPKNLVAFDNLYKNFSYFGILHLKPNDAIEISDHSKIAVKISSALTFRAAENVGPTVTFIGQDIFEPGSPTSEIVINIRNYFKKGIALNDLRITASIKDSDLDLYSGRVSVALPVPSIDYVLPLPASSFSAPSESVSDADGNILSHLQSAQDTPLTFTSNQADHIGEIITDIYPSTSTSKATALFAHGDIEKQNKTLTKKSRPSLVEKFQWDDALSEEKDIITSQAASTDTVIYDMDSDFTTSSPGRDFRSSFFSRSENNTTSNRGTYSANDYGEYLDLEYHFYYKPRTIVGSDFILIFIEEGTKDPVGNLSGPRDTNLVSTNITDKITESHSPTIALNGSIIPYNGSDKDLIYHTVSLEIPIDTNTVRTGGPGADGQEEPDAKTLYSIAFDKISTSGSTAGQTENDPSTLTMNATLVNRMPNEVYQYHWNWSHYFELDGDNPMIGMPPGAVLHGTDKHEITFSDAVGKHSPFTSIKVTIRANSAKNPDGSLRPFDPSTFDPTIAISKDDNPNFTFFENYDEGQDALDFSAKKLIAAVKLDLTSNPKQAHMVITPKTNGDGQIIASGSDIALAINYYLDNSKKIKSLQIEHPDFKLMEVYGKGTSYEYNPFWLAINNNEINGKILANGRIANENADFALALKFQNSDDYIKVRDVNAPVLSVKITDSMSVHFGSTFLFNFSNAYPPINYCSPPPLPPYQYSFVSLPTDGITAYDKKSKANVEKFLSVSNDTDSDGAVTFNMRVKLINNEIGENETKLMQSLGTIVNGAPLKAKSSRENQFVAYWEIRRISNQSAQNLLDVGNSSLNNWVLASPVDFVGSGADGNTKSIIYAPLYKAIYDAAIFDGFSIDDATLKARTGTEAALAGANQSALDIIVSGNRNLNPTNSYLTNTVGSKTLELVRDTIVKQVSIAAALSALMEPKVIFTQEVALHTITTKGGGLETNVSGATGMRSLVYQQIYSAVVSLENSSPIIASRVALAASKVIDNNLDEKATSETSTTYQTVYDAIFLSIILNTSLSNAKAQATIGANAAAAGANQTIIDAIVSAQALLADNPILDNLSNTAGGKQLEILRETMIDGLSKNTSKAITNAGLSLTDIFGSITVKDFLKTNLPSDSGTIGNQAEIYRIIFNKAISKGLPIKDATIFTKYFVEPLGSTSEDWLNLIPEDAHKFNSGNKGNAGQHDAILAVDPDDPSNTDLNHMLFSCRLILPTAETARDSYFVNFRFRPGTTSSYRFPIMTNSFVITLKP